ncbi:MAG: DUF1365 domain-containing protein [Fuerstiella sp.]
MHSCLYEGNVCHRRHARPAHEFRDSLFLVYLDLSELDLVFQGRWFWSTSRPALAWFRRADHLGPATQPLDECVRQLVETRAGFRPAGGIRLLTHLRYFGYVMNPVSFYFCYDRSDRVVEAVVAEVNNTPWGERHCYVIDARGTPGQDVVLDSATTQRDTTAGVDNPDFAASGPAVQPVIRAEHSKQFHVSPFLPMDLSYRWQITAPGERLTVHLQNLRAEQLIFNATLTLSRRPISAGSLTRMLLRYPLMTGKVITRIYWQALRLWLKKAVVFPHPSKQAAAGAGGSHSAHDTGTVHRSADSRRKSSAVTNDFSTAEALKVMVSSSSSQIPPDSVLQSSIRSGSPE